MEKIISLKRKLKMKKNTKKMKIERKGVLSIKKKTF